MIDGLVPCCCETAELGPPPGLNHIETNGSSCATESQRGLLESPTRPTAHPSIVTEDHPITNRSPGRSRCYRTPWPMKLGRTATIGSGCELLVEPPYYPALL
jgi:hypothetical protein